MRGALHAQRTPDITDVGSLDTAPGIHLSWTGTAVGQIYKRFRRARVSLA